jgi:sugar phosphate permease
MIEPEPQKKIFYGIWVIAGCFVLLFLFAGAGFYSFSIFIKPLEEQFGWSRGAISLTMSIYMILHGLVGPLVGHLTQTYGPKRIMTIFALGTGICFILVSLTPSLWYFYLIYAFLAIANSGIGFIPVSSLLAKWFIRRRGTAIGSAMVGISMGGLVLSPIIGQITYHFGWRISYVFLGLLVWLLAIPMTLFVIKGSPAEMGLMPDGDETRVPDNPNHHTEKVNHFSTAEDGWPVREAFRTRSFFWIMATFFLAPLAQMGVLQHQVPLIVDTGISEASAAIALGLTAGMGGLGKLSFGRVSEILPFRYTAMICFGLQALGVLVLLNAHSMAMVWLYVVIFGFSMGGVIVLLPLVVGHFFGLAAFGVIMGAVTLVQSLGNSSGTVISGLIYDYLGSYHYALLAYVGIYLLSIITIFMAGKPKPFPRV